MSISNEYLLGHLDEYGIRRGGRRKWSRPQAMLWADNAGVSSEFGYIPNGAEGQEFIILTDHNRADIQRPKTRIENRSRMINGTSRSYWTADKTGLTTSWTNLPSRMASSVVGFDEFGNTLTNVGATVYTVDNGAAAQQIKEWYESHVGAFYVYLSYDTGTAIQYLRDDNGNLIDGSGAITYNEATAVKLTPANDLDSFFKYTEVKRMYFSSFDYTTTKRGTSTYDMINISIGMEEA